MYLKNALGLVCFLAFLFIFPKTAHAATYYVSTSGNDSASGTQSSPWRTIQKAANTLVAGDTVYIRAGTYSEQLAPQNSGNSTSGYITYAAYPGDPQQSVILNGTGLSISHYGGLVALRSKSYIKVSGLKLINSSGMGIYISSGNYITLERNYIYNTNVCGIGVWTGNNIVIDGNDIEYAVVGTSEENLSISNGSYIEVKNNIVHDGPSPGGEGINIKDASHHVKVHHNVVHGIVKLAFGLDAQAQAAHDIEFYSNIAYNNGHGFIVEVEEGGTATNVKVYNNIAYNNNNPYPGSGFLIPSWNQNNNSPKRNVEFINNTSYGNGYGFNVDSTAIENIVIRNNILSQNSTAIRIRSDAPIAQITQDHNLITGDPLYVNPAAADFHLRVGSPAIDVGSAIGAPSTDFDGNPRPQGSGYDIGAFEYGSGGTPTPTTPPTSTPRPTSTPTPRPTATPSGCAFDINGDGIVNGGDISVILSYWRASCTSGQAACKADLNNSGRVETGDIASVIYQWGTRCQ